MFSSSYSILEHLPNISSSSTCMYYITTVPFLQKAICFNQLLHIICVHWLFYVNLFLNLWAQNWKIDHFKKIFLCCSDTKIGSTSFLYCFFILFWQCLQPLTENQLLFASKKFLQDSQEPSHREDISLRTSNKRNRPGDVNLHSGLLRCNFTLGFGV